MCHSMIRYIEMEHIDEHVRCVQTHLLVKCFIDHLVNNGQRPILQRATTRVPVHKLRWVNFKVPS